MIDKLHGSQLRANQLSETTKILTVLGVQVKKHFRSRLYGKASNISRRLAAYDASARSTDVLAMPTLPMKAMPIPPADAPRGLSAQHLMETIGNTYPFNIAHYWAMSLPCGMVDGLPIGFIIVGKHFDGPTIYQADHAFE